MKEEDIFDKIGKETPYKVPDGFFEGISEKTLLKAKQIEKLHINRLIIRNTVIMVASLAAVLLVAIFNPWFGLKPDLEPNVPSSQVKLQVNQLVENGTSPKEVVTYIVAAKEESEDYSEILADLSDEELLQIEMIYKSDPFID